MGSIGRSEGQRGVNFGGRWRNRSGSWVRGGSRDSRAGQSGDGIVFWVTVVAGSSRDW